MSIAIFPGSFDPITNGHLETINQASKLFDRLYVVVMTNINKQYLFSAAKRANFIEHAITDLQNVEVLSRPNSLTVDVASELGATAIVRGIRNSEDFLFEQQVASLNKQMAPDIETILLLAGQDNTFVASSMVKEIAHFGGDVSKFLPAEVAKQLVDKMRGGERE